MSLFGGIEIPGHPDLENVRKLDLLAIPLIRRCQRLGIGIDREACHELSHRFGLEIAELEKDIASYIPPEALNQFSDQAGSIEEVTGSVSFNASSAEQIGKLLFDLLGLKGKADEAGLKLKTTAGGKRISTGKRQLELLKKLEHPVIPKVLRHRELKKLVTTYTSRLPVLARFHPRGGCCPVCELQHASDQWRVHGEMGTTRAETGRINHKNPNLGNIPTRTDDGQALQACFCAPPGHRLLVRDLSQIELRCLAHLANCQAMISTYLANGDIHDQTSRKVFALDDDVKPDKVKHRMAAKRCIFSLQNGSTGRGLYMQLVMDYGASAIPVPQWLTEEWCDKFIEDLLDAYEELRPYFELQWYRARRYGMVWDLFGRVRLVPEIRSCHSWIRGAGLRQAQNLPITATAAGQLKLVMGKSAQLLEQLWDGGHGVWCWPLLTIHDAEMVEVEEDAVEAVDQALAVAFDECMTDQETGELLFRVPITSDGHASQRWEK